MFKALHINPRSQQAYELAAKGGFRQEFDVGKGLVYKFELIRCDIPEVVMDVTAVNVTEDFLAELVEEIGYKMRTNAVTHGTRHMRCGFLALQDCLSMRQWSAESVITNLLKIEGKIKNHDPFNKNQTLTEFQ